jgi:FkbM family methyltransferase
MKLTHQLQYLRSQPGFQRAPARVLFRLLAWRWICLFGRPKEVRLPRRKLTVHLPAEWRGGPKLIYSLRDDFEPDLAVLDKFLSPGSVMLDVGANLGLFTLAASRLVGASGRVAAFEPTQSTFSILEKNLLLNGITNVMPLRIALSDHAGKARLYHEADFSRNSLVADAAGQESEEVVTRTLDEVLPELKVGRVDFIKIDVEGADELVCRGAMQTLRTHCPAVLFEHNSSAAAKLSLDRNGTGGILRKLGYEFCALEGEELVQLEAESLPEANILAVHSNGRAQARP